MTAPARTAAATGGHQPWCDFHRDDTCCAAPDLIPALDGRHFGTITVEHPGGGPFYAAQGLLGTVRNDASNWVTDQKKAADDAEWDRQQALKRSSARRSGPEVSGPAQAVAAALGLRNSR